MLHLCYGDNRQTNADCAQRLNNMAHPQSNRVARWELYDFVGFVRTLCPAPHRNQSVAKVTSGTRLNFYYLSPLPEAGSVTFGWD